MKQILLYAIAPIIVVMLAGFIAGKRGAFSDANAKAFNKLVLDFALPSALFISLIQADRTMLAHDLRLALVALGVITGCFLAVYLVYRFCFRANTGAEAAVSALISGSPTIGFLGFAVLEPIFGTGAKVALVVAIVGIVVNAVGIPLGLSLLNAAGNGKDKGGGAWRPVADALAQPVAWAPILAVVLVLLGFKWHSDLSPSFELIAKANASVAVFSAGITLSAIRVQLNWQAVLGSIFKLIVMPAAALAVGLLVHMNPFNLKMLVVACSLPPAFSGIIIADEYNTYVATGTSSLALSVVLFVVFCPFWVWFTDLVV
jgi:hypothetical protein